MSGAEQILDWLILNTLDCGSVVEFGSGDSQFLACLKLVEHRYAVEIHEPSLDKTPEGIVRVLADMRHFEFAYGMPNRFDCAVFIDSLEHVTRDEALTMIAALKKRCRKILAFIPEGLHPQPAEPDNPHQEHKSTWFSENMIDLGFTVDVYPHFHHTFKDKSQAAMFCIWEEGE